MATSDGGWTMKEDLSAPRASLERRRTQEDATRTGEAQGPADSPAEVSSEFPESESIRVTSRLVPSATGGTPTPIWTLVESTPSSSPVQTANSDEGALAPATTLDRTTPFTPDATAQLGEATDSAFVEQTVTTAAEATLPVAAEANVTVAVGATGSIVADDDPGRGGDDSGVG
jgi:hypothetical protein